MFPTWQRKQTSRNSRKLRNSQKRWTQGSTHQGTSSLHYSRLKIRRESSKQQDKRRQLPTKEFPLDHQLISQKKPYRPDKKELERSIQSNERQRPMSQTTLSSKLSFRMEGQIKCFPDKVKLKEFIITKPLLYEMLKGLI